MIFKKDQLENVSQRLDYIKIQLGDLASFYSLDWNTYQKDRNIQRNIERLAENVANASIDVCKILLAGENIEMPNTYKEIILRVGQAGVIDEELAGKIAQFAELRNILAHQYLDLRWDKIKFFIANAAKDFEDFIREITKKNPAPLNSPAGC